MRLDEGATDEQAVSVGNRDVIGRFQGRRVLEAANLKAALFSLPLAGRGRGGGPFLDSHVSQSMVK
jgi:hypothetical protein